MTAAIDMMIFSGGAVLAAFGLALIVQRDKRLKGVLKQTFSDATGVILALGLLLFLEAFVQQLMGTSFYTLWRSGSSLPPEAFAAGALLGVIYEYVGQFVFPLWVYPAAEARRWLLLGLPLFWGVFMLIMQDTWAVYRHFGVSPWLALPLTALTQYGLIEGFNLITHSWRYKGFANTVWFLLCGWLALTATFVMAYNHFFVSAYGF